MPGYAVKLDQSTLTRLRSMPEVDYIEPNQVVWTTGVQSNPGNWGLDRISHRDLPLTRKYEYSDKAGEGVDVSIFWLSVLIDLLLGLCRRHGYQYCA